jgi:hypothetical protein
VYIFHVAAASFFHYLSSYFFANSHSHARPSLSAPWIAFANLGVLLVGCAVSKVPQLHWGLIVFGTEWFTLWVALHLVASDVMPLWKRVAQRATG